MECVKIFISRCSPCTEPIQGIDKERERYIINKAFANREEKRNRKREKKG